MKKFFSENQKLIPIVIFILGLGSMLFAFVFATKGGTGKSDGITPLPSVQPTEQPSVIEEPEPTETHAESPTPTPTPTPKPTSEPTQSPTPSPTPEPKTTTLNSTSGLDGFRSNNNGGNDSVEIRAGNGAFVGSPSYELVTRGFVSFDISSLPDNATVTKARLRLFQYQVDGNPYDGNNALKVDHMDYGSSLEAADYDASAIDSNIATLTQNAGIEWKDADVTSALKKDVNEGHSRSQFRIHFAAEKDDDGNEDMAYFYSANSGHNNNPPQLVVEYSQ